MDYVDVIIVDESKHSEMRVYDIETAEREIDHFEQLDLVYINLTLSYEFCNYCTEEYLHSDFIQGLINVLDSLQYICNLGYTNECLII